ncbi:cytochrome P450 [Coprinellus micaceus]|uniref:Cytochrome P450 n=1 Tax=Coprinellus micaceus TaxID=71717 RepID=A0A4Y7T2J4_COPMI|nr:cytochrome P450 [Coprinellus micaceus]
MDRVFLDSITRHSLLTVVVALPVAYAAYLGVSRLYFHPLSRVPGPLLASLTDYYVTYYDIAKDGQMVHQLGRLHARYGPIVRIGPNKLHFADPKAFDLIYRDVRLPKEPWFYDAFNVPLSLFAICDIPKAKEAASVLRPLFSRKNILQVEGVIQDVISHFLQVLSQRSKSSPRTNLHRGFASITMEVITTYSFAKSYGVVAYPSFSHPGLVGFQNSNFIIFVMRHFPLLRSVFFAMPLWLAGWFVPGIYGRRQFIQALDEQIAGILEDPTVLEKEEHEIVNHHLLNPKVGRKPGRRELIRASDITTANACIVAAFNVLKNPEIEVRLRKELMETWPEVETQLSLERLEKLPYLTAVIKEALRLSHGVVSPLPRVTIVSMGQSFMHYNPEIFPNPKEFRPERWLAKGSSDLENYLVPFNKGPRMCTGMNLAWAELYLIIGNMFRKVDMELAGTVNSVIANATMIIVAVILYELESPEGPISDAKQWLQPVFASVLSHFRTLPAPSSHPSSYWPLFSGLARTDSSQIDSTT